MTCTEHEIPIASSPRLRKEQEKNREQKEKTIIRKTYCQAKKHEVVLHIFDQIKVMGTVVNWV